MILQDVVPWGRDMNEYAEMFALSAADLKLKILGCGDGPSSFNAEMTAAGHSVRSIDPIYQFTREQINTRISEVYDIVVSQVKKNPAPYIWNRFKDADHMGQARLAAMRKFLDDYDNGLAAGRYRFEMLPSLSFSDRSFDLCLCSHFLFLYSDKLSLDFHIKSIEEMLRVAAEVRIFPLLNLDNRPSVHLEAVQEFFSKTGFKVEITKVNYEFQIGADKMMRISV